MLVQDLVHVLDRAAMAASNGSPAASSCCVARLLRRHVVKDPKFLFQYSRVTIRLTAVSAARSTRYALPAGTIAFRQASWSDLPTMYHVVNALANLPVLEERSASIARTHGGKSYRDTRILK